MHNLYFPLSPEVTPLTFPAVDGHDLRHVLIVAPRWECLTQIEWSNRDGGTPALSITAYPAPEAYDFRGHAYEGRLSGRIEPVASHFAGRGLKILKDWLSKSFAEQAITGNLEWMIQHAPNHLLPHTFQITAHAPDVRDIGQALHPGYAGVAALIRADYIPR